MNRSSTTPFGLALSALTGGVLLLAPACTSTTIVQEAPVAVDAASPDAGSEDAAPAERPTSRVAGKSATLFGSKASSYAYVDDETGVVVSVGYTVPVKAFADAPAGAPFQDDLVLEMPQVARDQTILDHVRVKWLPAGHGPDPYGAPHFDMHFQRGTVAEVDAIDCKADKRMPPASALPTGYGAPELCVNAMGMHSWPKADMGTAWKGSIIMGFWATKVSFIEPMISKAKLLQKKTFELPVNKPASTGGAHTLYPRRMTARYEADAASYSFEFDQFEEID